MAGKNTKLDRLIRILEELGSVVVAFSGGMDSSLLSILAFETLGERMVAVTARSVMFPEDEYDLACEIALTYGFSHETFQSTALEDPELVANPPERCYLCKKKLLVTLQQIASTRGFTHVVDGSNVDDTSDYRPGMKAVREMGVRSPLLEAGLGKKEIRELTQMKGIPGWERPSSACLASRIPYWRELTEATLRKIERSEKVLHELGFRLVRVRDWQDLALVELGPDEIDRVVEKQMQQHIIEGLKQAGYKRVAIDLEGYRMGSLNEALTSEERQA